MFDTKIAIVLRDDLAAWQALNVTAFLTSGIVGANDGLQSLSSWFVSLHSFRRAEGLWMGELDADQALLLARR